MCVWVWVGGGGSRLSANLPAPGARRPAPGARRRTPCLCANPREASVEATEGDPPLKAKKCASAAGDAVAFDFAQMNL